MSALKIVFPFLLILAFVSCQKEDEITNPGDVENPGDSMMPTGVFNAVRSGIFQAQNGYNAEGMAQLGNDDANIKWLRLAPDFNASLSTGAVTLYLSKNKNLSLNSTGSFLRVELVTRPGEHFYKIDPPVGDDFKFAILWCASAGVQFGNAELK